MDVDVGDTRKIAERDERAVNVVGGDRAVTERGGGERAMPSDLDRDADLAVERAGEHVDWDARARVDEIVGRARYARRADDLEESSCCAKGYTITRIVCHGRYYTPRLAAR